MSKNLSEIEILQSIALYCEQYGNTAENIRNNAILESVDVYKKTDGADIKKFLPSLNDTEIELVLKSIQYNQGQPKIPEEVLVKLSRDIDSFISDNWIKNTVFTIKKIVPAIIICVLIFFVSNKLLFPPKWRATYFNNRNLSGEPLGTYSERAPSNNWGFEAPKSGMSPNNFSVRYESSFDLDKDNSITFSVVGDDGIKLFVDEALVLDFWLPQDSIPRIATLSLAKGTHTVRLEYFEAEGGAKLYFNAVNSDKKEIKFKIPSN